MTSLEAPTNEILIIDQAEVLERSLPRILNSESSLIRMRDFNDSGSE